ncbi:MAG: CopG family transcriptional regulator [Chloroflexi bacterium]|nr:CopG family transcriptional regulator [Chloroflexota bacterium]
MKRTQVQLDEPTYELLRTRAFQRGISMSALLREVLRQHLAASQAPLRLEDFTFIGSGESQQGDLSPVSERHDEALDEAYAS